MKRLLILLLVLSAALILPVSAYYDLFKGSSSGTVYLGTLTTHTPDQICADAGYGVSKDGGKVALYYTTNMCQGNEGVTGYGDCQLYDESGWQTVGASGTYTFTVASGLSRKYVAEASTCTGKAVGAAVSPRWWYYNNSAHPIEATVNASPSSGWLIPQTITFVGTTLYKIADYKNFDIGYKSGGSLHTANGFNTISHTFSTPGDYYVNYTVINGTETYTASMDVSIGSSTMIDTYVQNVDGQTGGQIHNSDISIKDDDTGLWTNYTSDSDGTGYIHINSSHTLSAYGSATGYQSVSRTGLTPFDGVYELIMWPTTNLAPPGSGGAGDPGMGDVNLIVLVNDYSTGEALSGAQVSITAPSGAVTGQATGDSGSVTFVAPNSSVIRIAVSKTGYTSASKTITTSAMGPDTARVELNKKVITATPTSTIPPGGVTTAVTLDSRTSQQKGEDIMGILYDNGETIVGLCVVMIILGLLGVKLG